VTISRIKPSFASLALTLRPSQAAATPALHSCHSVAEEITSIYADFLVVDAVPLNRSPWLDFPGNRERTGNFKRKCPRGENLWPFPDIRSMACRIIPCAQEQGIRAPEQGKNIAESGTRLAQSAIINTACSAENE
jgi:hypothetical protein